MDILQTVIIAIVEGLTEFLPVSSTGHMIIAQSVSIGVVSSIRRRWATVKVIGKPCWASTAVWW